MIQKSRRMARERETVKAMINIYCHGKHGTRGGLCAECVGILNYANERLGKCPFQEGKTTCGNCRIHCYKPAMKEKIRAVMQYAGPRIIYRRPVLAVFHFIDGFKKEATKCKLKG